MGPRPTECGEAITRLISDGGLSVTDVRPQNWASGRLKNLRQWGPHRGGPGDEEKSVHGGGNHLCAEEGRDRGAGGGDLPPPGGSKASVIRLIFLLVITIIRNMSNDVLLGENEQKEAAAFDRVARHVSKADLITSQGIVTRYLSATLGQPFFNAFPDLVFVRLGRLLDPKAIVTNPQKPLSGLKVLDVGSGDGCWSAVLAGQGANVVSVEISPLQVDLARQRMRLSGLTWDARVCSVYRLTENFGRQSFDVVFGQGILHHLTLNLAQAIQQIQAMLRPGGVAIFTEPYSGSKVVRRIRESLAWLIPLNKESPDERPLTDADLALVRSSFRSVTIEHDDLFAKFARRVMGSHRLALAVASIDRALLRLPALRPFASVVFVICRQP